MKRGPPEIDRRKFLAATSATGVAGLAGCSALTSSDDEPASDDSESESPDEDSDAESSADELDADEPVEVVEKYYDSMIETQEMRSTLFHSEVAEAFRLLEYDVSVAERDIEADAIASAIEIDDGTAEEIVANEETAIVETEVEFEDGDQQIQDEQQMVLATEDGEWRIVTEYLPDSASDSDSDSATDEAVEPVDEIPDAVHDFLTEYEAGGYDGTLADEVDSDSLTITVGDGDSGLAFDPPVVRVDSGTEITWEWSGKGGAHNVVAADESDFDEDIETDVFDEEGHTATETFDEPGNYLYICQPHLAVGMVGAVIVE